MYVYGCIYLSGFCFVELLGVYIVEGLLYICQVWHVATQSKRVKADLAKKNNWVWWTRRK